MIFLHQKGATTDFCEEDGLKLAELAEFYPQTGENVAGFSQEKVAISSSPSSCRLSREDGEFFTPVGRPPSISGQKEGPTRGEIEGEEVLQHLTDNCGFLGQN